MLRAALTASTARVLACCLAALAAPVGTAAPDPRPGLPASMTLVYATTGNLRLAGVPLTLHARTTTTWRFEADRYETHLHTDTVGFDQASWGHSAADGMLVPEHYNEKRPFHAPDDVTVDWTRGEVRYGNAAPARAPERGAQDRLSLQFELARLRQRFPDRFAPGTLYAVNLIGTHDVDPWKFVVAEDATVQTRKGVQRATRFSARRTVGTAEETMDIWLGADVYWMPVRIRIVDRNQSVIDSVLEDVPAP